VDYCEAAGFFGFLWCHHHQHTRSAQLSIFLKARLRIEFYVFLHATRHHRAVQWAERPSRAAPCDGGLVGDNQVANCVVALVSTWRQTAPQRHLREIESNHQAAQRQIQRGRRRTLATACTSELLLELMLLLELLLLELLLLELLLLLLELLLLETDHEERELPRRSVRLGARTAQPSTHVAYFHRIRNFQ